MIANDVIITTEFIPWNGILFTTDVRMIDDISMTFSKKVLCMTELLKVLKITDMTMIWLQLLC